MPPLHLLPHSAVLGWFFVSQVVEAAADAGAHGPYRWMIVAVAPLDAPVSTPGRQSLWVPPPLQLPERVCQAFFEDVGVWASSRGR